MPFGDSTSTSKASPSSTRFCNWPTVPLSTTTLWPVAFSNSGTSATTTCLNAPVVSTLISAAVAGCSIRPIDPSTNPSKSPLLCFMVSPPVMILVLQAGEHAGSLWTELDLVEPLFQGHHVGDLPERRRPHVDNPTGAAWGGLLDDGGVVRQLPDQDVAAIARIGHPVMTEQVPLLQHEQQARSVSCGVPAIEIM